MLFDSHIELFENATEWLRLLFCLLAARAIDEWRIEPDVRQRLNPKRFFNV